MMLDETRETGVAVVIGAGTMGRGIAADLANAGWTVHLWDMTPEIAEAAKETLRANRPPLLFLDSFGERVLPGATGENLPLLATADWVVEAVAESLDVKRAVLAQVERHCGPRTVVTSNTSGLSLNAMASGCGPDCRKRFFGAHFLNPPRYLKLLEVIPTEASDPAVVAGFVRFAEGVLGHRVVLARDTPGFISTRLWITHLLDTMHTAHEMGVDVNTVDALTGPLIGRPRSATLRMADVVGLDIIAAVAANQYAALPDDPLRERLRLPAALARLLERGATGEKSGNGFYRRDGKAILTLDPRTLEYHPRNGNPIPGMADLLRLPLPERLAALKERQDTGAGRFVNAILDRLTAYADAIGPEIADDVLAIDRTMQWGFGWELGPFALADCRAGKEDNYQGAGSSRTYRVFGDGFRPSPGEPEYISLAALKAAGRTVDENEAASLVDLGEGVWCLEFHTKMNTLNPASCEFLLRAVERVSKEARAIVVGNEGPHFSAGYDLSRLVHHIEAEDWGAIDREMDACQRAFMALKYASVPVVAAPHGFTLGGGCEVALHCAAIQAAPELHIGLPEALVGLIPCGGGTKEVLFRIWERIGPNADPVEAARRALNILARPRHSTNAFDAREQGWLRPTDRISHNADRRLYDARQFAKELVKRGYTAPSPVTVPTVGKAGREILAAEIARLHADGTFTDHDARIATQFARLLSGPDDEPADLPETEPLAWERHLFLELCREPLTLARMRHLLETGKHLRN